MKKVLGSKYIVLFLVVAASFVTVSGCKSSSSASSDDANAASIAGTWSLRSLQCLSVPTEDFECWKSLIVGLGEIDMHSVGAGILTISDNGTFIGDEIPIIDSLPRSVFGCNNDDPHASKQHIDGTYSASEGLVILHIVHYLVNGQSQSSTNDEAVAGSYTISSSSLTLTLDLGKGERWKAVFVK
ncbi:MAG: hypothetical protein Q8916_12775 [Bacteroidota bacterium]|nr:hypothetical protein [Bacteroidota bacterium]MDP4231267.1 hypothetical protein [Bacteroidota bacterium]MDP4237175.1 hypothetical protein [Bacteroidota bacterium]